MKRDAKVQSAAQRRRWLRGFGLMETWFHQASANLLDN